MELIDANGRKEYVVASRFLETELGEKVCEKDLYFLNKVIWKSKGIPYEATILEVHREFMINYVIYSIM